jgi:hypothetical protein
MAIVSKIYGNNYIFYYDILHFRYRIFKDKFVESNFTDYYMLYEKENFYLNNLLLKILMINIYYLLIEKI